MKLIFSRFGVPSATPAHENSASIGPPISASAASIDAWSPRFTWIAFAPGELDLGEVHHDGLGARVLHELGDGRAHSGGAADDERPLAVETKGAECAHVVFSSFAPRRWVRWSSIRWFRRAS